MNCERVGYNQMARRFLARAVALLLLIAVCAAAGAEESSPGPSASPVPQPASPTDLPCLHEHLKRVIYFFDSPAYTPLSQATHRVSGPGVIETVCEDCGEMLDSETADEAVEVRPHTFKHGTCALCGYRQSHVLTELPPDLPGERTLIAEADADGLKYLTLTRVDLDALANAKVETALVRAETGKTAVALKVEELSFQAMETETDLFVEMTEHGDGSFFADVRLVSSPGERISPEEGLVALRFYLEQEPALRFSLTPLNPKEPAEEILEAEGAWDEENKFWTVPYLMEGTYFPLSE